MRTFINVIYNFTNFDKEKFTIITDDIETEEDFNWAIAKEIFIQRGIAVPNCCVIREHTENYFLKLKEALRKF